MAESIISPGVFTRENDISFITPAPIQAGAAFIGPTPLGPVEIPTIVTSYSDFVRKFGDTFQSGSDNHEFFTSMAVRSYFSQGGQTALVTRVVSGIFSEASASVAGSGSITSFTIETIGKGVVYNNSGSESSDGSLVSGSNVNVRWEVAGVNPQLGTFSLLIRRGDDNTNNKSILETFANISLDPNSDNYIEKVIGTQKLQIAGSGDYVDLVGTYPNSSNYVRVKSVNLPTINYLANDGITVNTNTAGVSYSASLPQVGSGSFSGATGTIANGAKLYETINGNTQGLAATDYAKVITLLSNKDDYQFNVISTPGLVQSIALHADQISKVIALAEQRQDCIAVVDLVGYAAQIAGQTGVVGRATGLNSSYAATYWPWLQIQSVTGKNVWVPASVVIPGVYAFTDASSAPWFAPAGLVRGGIGGAIRAERKLTKADRDILYAAKVNPIASFPGTGIAVFGQKTLQTKASALDRVNVRRLLIELKKFIGDQARNLVFEQNTIATRNRFLATVNPYLESVIQRQGLFAYRVVMDDSNNTADVIDRNQLIGQIFIQPTRTIEFVVLDFTIEPTGASFS